MRHEDVTSRAAVIALRITTEIVQETDPLTAAVALELARRVLVNESEQQANFEAIMLAVDEGFGLPPSTDGGSS
ncbi:MAG: hypothetical protein IH885_04430 [Myxococcales bacterium]|nr:hypothetical protein [Myxococcales bacterium]